MVKCEPQRTVAKVAFDMYQISGSIQFVNWYLSSEFRVRCSLCCQPFLSISWGLPNNLPLWLGCLISCYMTNSSLISFYRHEKTWSFIGKNVFFLFFFYCPGMQKRPKLQLLEIAQESRRQVWAHWKLVVINHDQRSHHHIAVVGFRLTARFG